MNIFLITIHLKKNTPAAECGAPRHSNRCFTKPNMRRKHQSSTAGGYNRYGYTLLFRIAIRDYVFSERIWFLYRKGLRLAGD